MGALGRRKDETYSQVPSLSGLGLGLGLEFEEVLTPPEMFSHDFKCGWSAVGFDFTQSPKLLMYNCICSGQLGFIFKGLPIELNRRKKFQVLGEVRR